MTIKKMFGTFLASMMIAVFAFAASGATVTVTGNTSAGENQPGWLFNRDSTTTYVFNSARPDIGFGSLYVGPVSAVASDKFVGENFINTAIANVDSISYDFSIGSGTAANANQFYMNVYANFGISPDLKFYDCRYDVVPTAGSTTNFTTVTFDPTLAYPVTTSGSSPFPCPAIPADMNINSSGSNIRMFALNVGDSSPSDAGLSGYFDKVVVSTTTGSTTYDFEPKLTPTSKDQCKNGGWMNFNTPVFKNQGDCIQFVNTGK